MTLYKWAAKGQPLTVCIVANANLFLKSLCQRQLDQIFFFFTLWCDLLIWLWNDSLISLRWRLLFSVVATCRGLIPLTIITTFKCAHKSNMITCFTDLAYMVYHLEHTSIYLPIIYTQETHTHPFVCRCMCCWGHFSSCGDGRATHWRSWGPTSRWRQCQR